MKVSSNTRQPPWERMILLFTTLPVLVLGCVVLIGWVTHSLQLIQIDTSFPPMQINTVLCFLFSGLSLFFILLDRKRSAMLAACVVIFLSGSTLCEYLFHIDLGVDQLFFTYNLPYYMVFPGRMAPNTATCFLLSGLSLVLTILPYRRVTSILAEVFTGIVVLIAALVLYGYVSGLASIIGWSDFTGMAFHTSFGLTILNVGIFHYHFVLALRHEKVFYAPVLATVFLAAGITIALWQSFNTQQYNAIQKLAQNNADFVADNLRSGVDGIGKALMRIALRLDVLNGYDEILWNVDVNNYIKDIPSLDFISWYNDALQLEKYSTHFEVPMPQNSHQVIAQMIHKRKSKGSESPIDIFLVNKKVYFLIDVFVKGVNHSGFLFVQLDLNGLVESAVPKFVFDYYTIEISDNEGLIYGDAIVEMNRIGKGASSEIHFPLMTWNIKVFPTQRTLTLVQSFLPNWILVLGLMIAFFMALSVLLVQLVYSAQIKTAEALDEKAEALAYRQAILDSSNYSIISTDIKGKILSFNHAAERMLLWKADEMIGKATFEVFHDKKEVLIRAQELSDQLKRVVVPGFDVFVEMPKQGKAEEREWTYLRKDSTSFPVKLSVAAVKNSLDMTIGFVGIAYDLTETKALDRMKAELIAITSHEIRSPLAALKGSLDLISAKEVLTEEGKSIIRIARNSCERLIKLTNDILDLQKMESGKMEFHFKNIKISELVHKAVEVNQLLAKSNKIMLKEPSDIPEYIVYGDEDRLIQVLTNFISNAFKYSQEGSEVSVSVLLNGQSVRVGVKDLGPGIPKEFQSLLFQKFSQIPSVKPRAGGSGLGLSICKSIIEAHGGVVGFDTCPAGSVFWFELLLVSK